MQTPADLSPPRPDAAPGTVRGQRKWLPVFAVSGVLIVVVLGGYVAAAALATPAGPPLSIGGSVRFQPLSGWRFVQRVTDAGVPGVLVTRGSGSLEVLAAPTDQTAEALAEFYAREVL